MNDNRLDIIKTIHRKRKLKAIVTALYSSLYKYKDDKKTTIEDCGYIDFRKDRDDIEVEIMDQIFG